MSATRFSCAGLERGSGWVVGNRELLRGILARVGAELRRDSEGVASVVSLPAGPSVPAGGLGAGAEELLPAGSSAAGFSTSAPVSRQKELFA